MSAISFSLGAILRGRLILMQDKCADLVCFQIRGFIGSCQAYISISGSLICLKIKNFFGTRSIETAEDTRNGRKLRGKRPPTVS